MSSFPRHQRSREVSLEDHVRSAQITLGERLTGKALVYLDSNYWINLQQATKDAETDTAHVRLLEILRNRVASGALPCPISNGHFSGIDEAS
jgi:hypothetical protein